MAIYWQLSPITEKECARRLVHPYSAEDYREVLKLSEKLRCTPTEYVASRTARAYAKIAIRKFLGSVGYE